jgi:hypothetical protein
VPIIQPTWDDLLADAFGAGEEELSATPIWVPPVVSEALLGANPSVFVMRGVPSPDCIPHWHYHFDNRVGRMVPILCFGDPSGDRTPVRVTGTSA